MLDFAKIVTIDQDENYYLSFPDIVRSVVNPTTFFMAYRSGNGHHPTKSNLIIKKSTDNGHNWTTIKEIPLNLHEDKYVWNCPRLSYVGATLCLTCDSKSGTYERTSQFKTVFLASNNEGKTFMTLETPIPGMVPDKIVIFKGKFFCANHKIKNEQNHLIQLVSWSKDRNIWYDTNVMAHSLDHQFCEASIVNMNDEHLIAYLRDNSGHVRNIHTVTSKDGIEWSTPKKLNIFGQRVTARKYDDTRTMGAFRNTANVNVSLFVHDLKTGKLKTVDIDHDHRQNLYNFGYTGLEYNGEDYLLPYYIKKDEPEPYINLAFIPKKELDKHLFG